MWQTIHTIPLDELRKARIELHRFVQLIAATARSYHPADPGDSYGALRFQHHAFQAKAIGNGYFFSLSPFEYSIKLSNGESFFLEGKSPEQAAEWIRLKLAELGLDPKQYSLELPYEIPDYGAPSRVGEILDPKCYQVLGAQYHNACLLLEKLVSNKENSSEVICWPHHFDIATLVTLKEAADPEDIVSIGIGLSPGDDNYAQPYFYLTPWPYPSSVENMKLSCGSWHTEGWTGAVLTYEEITELSNQEADIEGFIFNAYGYLESALL